MIFLMHEWLELVLRWFHVIAGIAWIGSSFYFIALDLSLKQNQNLPYLKYASALIFLVLVCVYTNLTFLVF